jgi:hypothetical protein
MLLKRREMSLSQFDIQNWRCPRGFEPVHAGRHESGYDVHARGRICEGLAFDEGFASRAAVAARAVGVRHMPRKDSPCVGLGLRWAPC